jgi:hypothetical protein
MVLQEHGRDDEARKVAANQEDFPPEFSNINLAGDQTADFVVTRQGEAMIIVRSLNEGHSCACTIEWAHPASKKALGAVYRK